MRARNKDCSNCGNTEKILYRCRYQDAKEWVFLCGQCLTSVKLNHTKTYQYGGTWKSKKK
ncbi:MAG: hypothetical protein CMM39_09960 [Rhodospirillaceae bacterium]|nr:hypothetical protein [Rhodospirillaceae bacterium]